MNKNLKDAIVTTKQYSRRNISCANLAGTLLGELTFSDRAQFNLMGGSIWITTDNRADVEQALSIAPKGRFWTKEPEEGTGVLIYRITVGEVPISLRVTDAALPPTCRVEEVPEEIPAQPARTVMRKIVRCDVAPAAE